MKLALTGLLAVGTYDYEGVSPARLVRDDDLVEAAPYCAESL